MKKINKICPVCSTEFSVNKCHAHRYITCGYTCGGIYRTKPIHKNICEYCCIEFVSKKHPKSPQRFCSRNCALKSRDKKITFSCQRCNENFQRSEWTFKNIKGTGTYCSQKCRLEAWNDKSIEAQNPGSYRRNAWKVYEKKCYECGYSDERCIVIHHIDGDRKNGKLSNLIPLCHNCHCLAHIAMSGNHRLPSYRGQD